MCTTSLYGLTEPKLTSPVAGADGIVDRLRLRTVVDTVRPQGNPQFVACRVHSRSWAGPLGPGRSWEVAACRPPRRTEVRWAC